MLPPPLLSIAPEQSRELPKSCLAVCLTLVTHRDRQRTHPQETRRVAWTGCSSARASLWSSPSSAIDSSAETGAVFRGSDPMSRWPGAYDRAGSQSKESGEKADPSLMDPLIISVGGLEPPFRRRRCSKAGGGRRAHRALAAASSPRPRFRRSAAPSPAFPEGARARS